jgi:acetyl esterase/lipase
MVEDTVDLKRTGARWLLALTVFMVALAGCSNNEQLGTESTLTYCSPGGLAEQLDVYTPIPAPTAPVPAIVYVHGGGWISGSDSLSVFIGLIEEQVVGSGEIFVSVNYRLAPQYRWPSQIEDVKCAVRFLRQDAGALNIDPDRIGAIGDSAGGQLVSMLALAGPTAGFDVGQYPDQSSAVQAVVDLYGPADLTAPDWTSDPSMQTYAADTFGQAPGSTAAVLTSASPVAYVAPGAPPFLIVQGDRDAVVPPDQSRELARRLQGAGDRATLLVVHNAAHGLLQAGSEPVSPGLIPLSHRIVGFLDDIPRG